MRDFNPPLPLPRKSDSHPAGGFASSTVELAIIGEAPQALVDMKSYFFETGELTRKLPKALVEDCSAGGRDASPYVDHWIEKLGAAWNPPAELCRCWLREFGAWDAEELSDDSENARRAMWLLAGEQAEQGEAYGLIH